jgi:hypothetical protein
MATTYTLISSVTVGSGGAATIDFTSIPSTYTDLNIILSGRGTADTFNAYVRFNSSTSNYSQRRLQGTGTVAESTTDTEIIIYNVRSSYTATVFSNGSAYIPNYAGSNYKSVSVDTVTENNATVNRNVLNAGLWSDTSAITSVNLVAASGNFAEYSTAYLYGISNA